MTGNKDICSTKICFYLYFYFYTYISQIYKNVKNIFIFLLLYQIQNHIFIYFIFIISLFSKWIKKISIYRSFLVFLENYLAGTHSIFRKLFTSFLVHKVFTRQLKKIFSIQNRKMCITEFFFPTFPLEGVFRKHDIQVLLYTIFLNTP